MTEKSDRIKSDGAMFAMESRERDPSGYDRALKGERYPCKPDIFEATYEPASAPREQSASTSDEEAAAEIVSWVVSGNVRFRGSVPLHDMIERTAAQARAEGKAEGMEAAAKIAAREAELIESDDAINPARSEMITACRVVEAAIREGKP